MARKYKVHRLHTDRGPGWSSYETTVEEQGFTASTFGAILGVAAIGAVAAGAMAVWLAISTGLVLAIGAIGLSRWPLTGLLLLVAIGVIAAMPAGRPHRKKLIALGVMALVMVPLSMVSLYSVSNSSVTFWDPIAAIPLLPALAVVLTVYSLIKQWWKAAAAAVAVLVASVVPYVGALVDGTPFVEHPFTYDNLVATLTFLILLNLVAIFRTREA